VNTTWFDSPVWLIVNALVAYRLTRLWIDDKVPPLPWLREKVQAYADRDFVNSTNENPTVERWSKQIERYGQPPLMFLINCYWCAGFWISAGTVLAAVLIPASVWPFIALPLALSAIVGLLGTRD
jgi:hypothetical protein